MIRTKFNLDTLYGIIYDPSEELPKDVKIVSTEKLNKLIHEFARLQKEINLLSTDRVGLPHNIIGLPVKLVGKIFHEEKEPTNVLSLYLFYYNTSKWQKTNQVWATDNYCKKNLHWGTKTLLETKKRLKELGLIELIRKRNENGEITKWFIKVRTIQSIEPNKNSLKQELSFASTCQKETDALNNNTNINALSNKKRNACAFALVSDENTQSSLQQEESQSAAKSRKPSKLKKSEEGTFSDFLLMFPSEYQKDKSFHKAAHHFYTYRKKRRGGKFSLDAMKRIVNKSEPYSIEIIMDAFNRSIENDWTGFFPESIKSNGSAHAQNSHSDAPDQILAAYFGKDTERCQSEIFKPLAAVLNGSDHYKVAESIGVLYEYCTKRQKRPEFEITPKAGDLDYGTYCNWRDLVPRPYQIVKKYIDWLLHTRNLTSISHQIFLSSGKYFNWFLDDLRKRTTVDPFTGTSFYETKRQREMD